MTDRTTLINEAAREIAGALAPDGDLAATLAAGEQHAATEPEGVYEDTAIRALYPLTNRERAEILVAAEAIVLM